MLECSVLVNTPFRARLRVAVLFRAMLVSAATDVAFWDPGRSDEPLHLSTVHTSPVTSLRWTSNDRVLASSAHDGTIHLTESDGRLFDTLRPTVPGDPAGVLPVLSLSWSPGSRYLAAGGSDKILWILLLEHAPLHFHIVTRMTPITHRIEVAQVDAFV